MAALGVAALSLAACDDARWLAEQVKKGGTSSGSSGGPAPTGGSPSERPGTGGASGQPACTSDVFGGADLCTDVATLKQSAYRACEKGGLTLADYAPYDACGTDSYRFVKYSCCPRVDPPPPPPPSGCLTLSEGGPTSCKDVGTWKQYASEACETAGMLLSAYSPYEDCGGGNYRNVKYSCCSKVPPPPPATECTTQSQGGPTSCKDVGTWKQYASEACEAAGMLLSAYSPYEDCGDGNTRYVKYSCCGKVPPPPPPPPPPSDCVTQSQGGPTSCKDVGTWKQYASEACEAAGMLLNTYSAYEDCGGGNTRNVKYICCPSKSPASPPAN